MRSRMPAPNSRKGIHRLATNTSTMSMMENWLSRVFEISLRAAWLAPPPIHDPATVDKPRQYASGASPPKTSGLPVLTSHKASGPPTTMPSVAAKNMTMALGPRL